MKLFYATDVHGSEICWKKFISGGKFYQVDLLILGGDMTGKAIVPIVSIGNQRYKVTLLDQETILENQDEVDQMVKMIQNRGYYPYITNPDEVAEISSTPGRSDELFLEQALMTVQRWMEYAEEKLAGSGVRCFVCPGNDDVFEIDKVIGASKAVEQVEGQVIQLDDKHAMLSSGWSNPTPWDTHREEPDEQLLSRIESMIPGVNNMGSAIFNLHPPPYGSGLDDAPELTKDMRLAYAGQSMVPVGSKAVLEVIQKYQPLLGLHGHIHESKGTRKFKKTLCINPGSNYEQGVLNGAVIELKPNKVASYILTTG
ncbi:MAG: metallophosphoesterase family protein [Anaerolineales bacterium]